MVELLNKIGEIELQWLYYPKLVEEMLEYLYFTSNMLYDNDVEHEVEKNESPQYFISKVALHQDFKIIISDCHFFAV